MKNNLLNIILLFISVNAFTQYQYQNPASIKWKQIKTDHFVVVFPKSITERGIETANLLEIAYKPVNKSLNTKTPPISVYLFNQSITSNGFTALAPRYIVFYTTPPQNANLVGGTDWIQTLIVHEYRHAAQYAKLDQNLTTFLGGLAGDFGKVAGMNISIPKWVFEGDAVCTETVYSSEGRGRLPSFTRDIRANELEKKRYSYYKAYLGSYKDYIPNVYHLGYLMTAHIRKNYGDAAWSNILDRTTKLSVWPYKLSNSLGKYTRFSTKKTYKNCLNEFNSIWNEKLDGLEATDYKKLETAGNKFWTNYTYPFYISNDKVVALKYGLANSSELVLIEKGFEEKLKEISPVDRIHSNGKFVVWASEVPDLRWGERSYSNIMVYDLAKRSLSSITKKKKYFAPAISPDGESIAVVEYGDLMKCALVIIGRKNGKVTYRFETDENSFIRMPSWSSDGTKIVFTVSKGQERKISTLDLENNSLDDILLFTTESVTYPIFYKDFILFNSAVSGIDAIYSIDLQTHERYSVIVSRYGAYNPSVSPDGNELFFQDYSSKGHIIGTVDLEPKNWEKVVKMKSRNDNYFQFLVDHENGSDLFDTVDLNKTQDFKIKKYFPFFHSINLHSWLPYRVNNGVAFSVFSNDKLNTTTLAAGINYFPKSTATREFVNLIYAGLYPVFDVGVSYGRLYDVQNDTSNSPDYREMNEKVFRAGLSLPFNLSRNIYTTTININAAYNYIYNDTPQDSLFSNGSQQEKLVVPVELGFKLSNMKQMALRDINPKFGQLFNVLYWYAPFEIGEKGERFLASATFYLPGLFKHHSLTLYGGYQENSSQFRNGIYKILTDNEFVRGYDPNYYEFAKFINGMINYSFPLFPDLIIGPILYCKRIVPSLFYDYGIIKDNNLSDDLSSVGIDLNASMNFFSLIPTFEMGVRCSYLIEDKSFVFEFLVLGVAF